MLVSRFDRPPVSIGSQGTIRVGGEPISARFEHVEGVWAVTPADGASVLINGCPLRRPWVMRAGEVVTAGGCELTFWPVMMPLEDLGPEGNGFSRARLHIALALQGLDGTDRDLLEALANLEGAVENADRMGVLQPALARMNEEDFTGALELLDEVLLALPRHADGLLHKALCLVNTRNFVRALPVARDALANATYDATRTAAEKLLAQIEEMGARAALQDAIEQMNAGRFDAAESGLLAASERFPESAGIWLHLAMCQMKSGALAEARRSANQAAQFGDPDTKEQARDLKEQLETQGLMVLQPAAAKMVARDLNGALSLLEEVLAVQPEHAATLLHKAVCLAGIGELEPARAAVKAVHPHERDGGPFSISLILSREVEETIELARSLQEHLDVRASRSAGGRGTPRGLQAKLDQAAKEIREHRLANADRILTKASKQFPESAEVWLELAQLKASRGEKGSAEDCLERAEDIGLNAAAGEQVFLLRLSLGLERLARLDDPVEPRRKDRVPTTLLPFLDQVLGIRPEHAGVLLNRAVCLANLGEIDDAQEAANEVLRLTWDDATQRQAGELLAELSGMGPRVAIQEAKALEGGLFGGTAEAERSLTEAAEQFPDSAEIWLHLAVYQAKSGKLRAAQESIGSAETHASDPAMTEQVADVRRQIAQLVAKEKIDEAMKAFEDERWGEAVDAFQGLPSEVLAQEQVRLMYCAARGRSIASDRYLRDRSTKLARVINELRELAFATSDENVVRQAAGLIGELERSK